MRKFRAWALLAVMGLFVFAVSGCGGGSLDSNSNSESANPTIPNDYPDTYDTQKILGGTWYVLDESKNFSAEDFSFRLNSAALKFESTDIESTIAHSTITSSQDWQVYYADDDEDDEIIRNLGSKSLGLSFARRTGTMIHQGKDRWRCSIDGENSKVVMNITVISATVIEVNYQGSTGALYNGFGTDYDFTLTFRKAE